MQPLMEFTNRSSTRAENFIFSEQVNDSKIRITMDPNNSSTQYRFYSENVNMNSIFKKHRFQKKNDTTFILFSQFFMNIKVFFFVKSVWFLSHLFSKGPFKSKNWVCVSIQITHFSITVWKQTESIKLSRFTFAWIDAQSHPLDISAK